MRVRFSTPSRGAGHHGNADVANVGLTEKVSVCQSPATVAFANSSDPKSPMCNTIFEQGTILLVKSVILTHWKARDHDRRIG